MKNKVILLLVLLVLFNTGCKNQQSIDIVPELYDSELKNISTKNYFYIPKDQTNIDLSKYAGKDAYLVLYNLSDKIYKLNPENENFGSVNINGNATENLLVENIINETILNEHPTHVFMNEVQIDKSLTDYSRKSHRFNPIEKVDYKIGDKLLFKHQKQTNVDTTIIESEAQCKFVGNNCVLWFSNNSNIENHESNFDFIEIGKKFDYLLDIYLEFNDISFKDSNNLQIISFPDGYKLNIILFDIDPYLDAFVKGYFNNSDYFLKKHNDFSNEGKFLYIDSTFPESIFETFIHEYTHLKTYESKVMLKDQRNDTWYTEMLSMLAEEIFEDFIGDNIERKKRLSNCMWNTNNGLFYWKKPNENLIHSCYSNNYTFGTYLLHNYGGLDFYKELIFNDYTNAMSIDEALKKYDSSLFEALVKYPQIFVNCNNNNSELFTLNKNTNSVFSEKYPFQIINSIDFSNYCIVLNDINQTELIVNKRIEKVENESTVKVYGPRIFKTNHCFINYYNYGFSISYIGNINVGDILEVKHPTEEDLVYLLMITNPSE